MKNWLMHLNMKNSKSPGMDGFTAEFFKIFLVDLGKFIVKSVNYAYKNGSLSVTQNSQNQTNHDISKKTGDQFRY